MLLVTLGLWTACFAAAIGLAMGVTALVNPAWAGRLVRLQPDPNKREGHAELRANYGGLFTGLHAVVLVWLLMAIFASVDPWPSAVAATPVAAGWLWLGLVRLGFANADGAVTRYNLFGSGFEIAMGLAIGAPFLAMLVVG